MAVGYVYSSQLSYPHSVFTCIARKSIRFLLGAADVQFKKINLLRPRRRLEIVSTFLSPLPNLIILFSEDKSAFADLARSLVNNTGCSVAIPNYRLTTKENALCHPAHSEDILAFLEFIITWRGPIDISCFDNTQIYPVGHSCSTHMLCSIFLDSSQITPSLTPSPSLLTAVKGIVLSEGIYDLATLTRTFENYAEWFVIPAFGEDKPLEAFDITRYGRRRGSEDIRWLILHSKSDTLIDMAQSERAFEHLKGSAIFIGDRLCKEHDEIFTEDAYIDAIRDFIQ